MEFRNGLGVPNSKRVVVPKGAPSRGRSGVTARRVIGVALDWQSVRRLPCYTGVTFREPRPTTNHGASTRSTTGVRLGQLL
jgi:hypothetical protein